MNKPTTYTATFSTGQVFKRKSVRPYAYAWSVISSNPNWTGFYTPSFARTRELAEKALAAHISRNRAGEVVRGEIVAAVMS